jgi:putative SOS response-associated peptidase YedK
MCGTLKRFGIKIIPGYQVPVRTKEGTINMVWGFNNGKIYNARTDKLDTTWRNLANNRCVLEVDSFDEKNAEFNSNIQLYLGGIYNFRVNEFALLTTDADSLIAQYHHRMPLIVDDIHYFLHNYKFGETFKYYIKLVA